MAANEPLGVQVAVLTQRMNDHERVCGDRYRLLLRVVTAGISVLVATAAFGIGAVYKNINDKSDSLQIAIERLQ